MVKKILIVVAVACVSACSSLRPEDVNKFDAPSRGRYLQIRNFDGVISSQSDRFDYEGCKYWYNVWLSEAKKRYGSIANELVDCATKDASDNLPFLATVRTPVATLKNRYRNQVECEADLKESVKAKFKVYDACVKIDK